VAAKSSVFATTNNGRHKIFTNPEGLKTLVEFYQKMGGAAKAINLLHT
jgi:hypothetical protein